MLVLIVDWTFPGIVGAWPGIWGLLSIIPGGPWEGPACMPEKWEYICEREIINSDMMVLMSVWERNNQQWYDGGVVIR